VIELSASLGCLQKDGDPPGGTQLQTGLCRRFLMQAFYHTRGKVFLMAEVSPGAVACPVRRVDGFLL
jgi:hypothetical protein